MKRMLELVAEFPRFGYRQIGRLLRQEGFQANIKRIYRLWRQEGLKVPQKKLKKRRLGDVTGGITRRQAEYKDHVWSVDFIFDRTTNGRALKIVSVIDEYTRECLALEVGRKLTSEQLIEVLTELFGIRGVPGFIRYCPNSVLLNQLQPQRNAKPICECTKCTVTDNQQNPRSDLGRYAPPSVSII